MAKPGDSLNLGWAFIYFVRTDSEAKYLGLKLNGVWVKVWSSPNGTVSSNFVLGKVRLVKRKME